jgi:2-iminoacetate synthase
VTTPTATATSPAVAAREPRRGAFQDHLEALPIRDLAARARDAADHAVTVALARAEAGHADLDDLAALLSPAAEARLEELAGAANRITERRFGRTVRLFAPLYLSNACLSTCTYCGFSKHLDVRRRTLTPAEVEREARLLTAHGFRHLLLVSAEHGKEVSSDYLELVARRLRPIVPSLAIETQVWDLDVYRRLATAGLEAVVVYQETYDPDTYAEVHVAGRKRRYDVRLAAPEVIADAGLRRVGLGALFGLHADWRQEALALLAHAQWLQRVHWRIEVTVAFPRPRPPAGGRAPRGDLGDRELAQLIAASRLFLHDVGVVVSTREDAPLRDGLVPLGVTHMSAGSSTEPGGYSDAGASEEQFSISDERPPAEVAEALSSRGYDPVWKDWSPALSADAEARL